MERFLVLFRDWINAQILLYQAKIAQRRAEYKKKNWRWSEEAVADFNTRITEFRSLHDAIANEFTFGRRHGNNLLILCKIAGTLWVMASV